MNTCTYMNSVRARTKSCRGLRHGTRDFALLSRISPVDGHCALPASLLVPPVRLLTVGSRVFSVAAWSPCLEHPARRDDISTITDDFLSTSESLAFQTILS